MIRIDMKDAEGKREDIINYIKEGKIFVTPTDTVYGLGCDATNPDSVKKIRAVKNSPQPFSVIAPSKEWIRENLIIKNGNVLDRLPGPYTLIFKKKKAFLEGVSPSNKLGVRIPDHPLTAIIQASGRPFVTTSCNVSGEKTIKSISELSKEIQNKVNVIIDDGVLDNKPSKVIDYSEGEEIVRG